MSIVPDHFTHVHDSKLGNGVVLDDSEARLKSVLDDVLRRLTRLQASPPASPQESHKALDDLFLELRRLKLDASAPQWQQLVHVCRAHALIGLLHEDPFTRRAFAKPRGYAGDAQMLDYIYGREDFWPAPPASPLGKLVFDYTTVAPASQGVRARRGFIAELMDRMAKEGKPDVLSVACGHLREAELSAALKRRRLGRVVALDADEQSLQEVERCYARFSVETFPARVRELLSGRLDCGSFDLIYSTGLFDYLGAAAGRRLVGRLFGMLRSRGKLLVANFLPGIHDLGYMEAYMDWTLVYRTRQEMIDLTMDIAQAQLHDIEIFAEENQNIIFLLLTRN